MKVVVTGATGYVGGRLVPRLLERGFEVRCMTRDPNRLRLDPWRQHVELVAADATNREAVLAAVQGCDAAFYLIHAMAESPKDFPEADRLAATAFRDAAARVGLRRLVYLGGLGSPHDGLSRHLTSRQEVGRILASGATPVTELRAAVIIGSGSISFEVIRHLTEILPIMLRPRWLRTRCQPIAIRDVLAILIAAVESPGNDDHVYDIGGPDILTYQEMMQEYAVVAGLRRRLVIPMPVLASTRLSAYFVGMSTPLPKTIVRPLIESLRNDVVVTRASPPGFEPETLAGYRVAVERALAMISHDEVETKWSDAVTHPGAPLPTDPVWSGAKVEADRRIVISTAPPEDVFWAVSRIGGDAGYYAMNGAWRLRGWFDRLIGGVGLRRGRRHPEELRPGETLDFFRVVDVDPVRHRLLLQAEMKVPGTAWLGWTVDDTEEGTRLIQSARFIPRGLIGRIYWWVLLPFHAPIFRLMARRIVRSAERRHRDRMASAG
ncbi:MAG TPA: SDR family oxidoreductase [Acidimicrobiia bacterium]|nr:SDR family oxidoreductase [Acidimicrobiia bacterium]